jgi:hypothetical protein
MQLEGSAHELAGTAHQEGPNEGHHSHQDALGRWGGLEANHSEGVHEIE